MIPSVCEPAFASQNRAKLAHQAKKATQPNGQVAFLVGMTGFEPATSCSQTLKCRFFPYFTRLFGAFKSKNDAFGCSCQHCFHVVRSRRWSKVWSSRLPQFMSPITRPRSSYLLPIVYHTFDTIASPFSKLQNLRRSSQRKHPAKKVEILSKKVWTSAPFCGIVVC